MLVFLLVFLLVFQVIIDNEDIMIGFVLGVSLDITMIPNSNTTNTNPLLISIPVSITLQSTMSMTMKFQAFIAEPYISENPKP